MMTATTHTLALSDESGVIERFPDFASQFVPPRHVDVWLPPGYADHPETRYPVIYMPDGQNLFDPALAHSGVDWGVDEAVARLSGAGGWPGAIVVGVWNIPQRWAEYMPARPMRAPRALDALERFIEQAGAPPHSDALLDFLAHELKPLIDRRYRSLPDPEHTVVIGSSMGGLLALYALTERPHVFGRAGCLSTHWVAGENVLVDGLAAALPPPGQHRLYFDRGTAALEASYAPYQERMDARLRAAGYQEGRDWTTRVFEGAEHHESSWRARLEAPLRFLFGIER